jgi:hypothetical protein
MSIKCVAYVCPIVVTALVSVGLTACSSGDIPLGQAQSEAVTKGKNPPSGGGAHGGSSSGSSSGTTTGSSSGASGGSSGSSGASSSGTTGASCTPSTALAGSYTLVSKDGVPVTGAIEKVARITIAAEVSVESQIQVGAGCTVDCILFSLLPPGSMHVGKADWGNVGTTDGEFNADKTGFTWTTDGLLGNTNAAQYGVAFAGVSISGTLTETSPCEVQLVAQVVRDDLPAFVAPTTADLVTHTFVLARP